LDICSATRIGSVCRLKSGGSTTGTFCRLHHFISCRGTFFPPIFQFHPMASCNWIACHLSSRLISPPGLSFCCPQGVKSIRLLTKRECRKFSTNAQIISGRFAGFTKSCLVPTGLSDRRRSDNKQVTEPCLNSKMLAVYAPPVTTHAAAVASATELGA
jgi:hypothetical protein